MCQESWLTGGGGAPRGICPLSLLLPLSKEAGCLLGPPGLAWGGGRLPQCSQAETAGPSAILATALRPRTPVTEHHVWLPFCSGTGTGS